MSAPDPLPDDEALAQALRASRRLEDAPAALVRRAIGLWPAAPSPLGAALRRVVAALVSDSGPAPALALGLRAGGGGGARQIVCAAEGLDIDLRVMPATDGPAGWRLAGQLLGADRRGEALLRAEGEPPEAARRTPLDACCEFRFGPLAAGRWTLALRLDEVEIELPPIELPPPA